MSKLKTCPVCGDDHSLKPLSYIADVYVTSKVYSMDNHDSTDDLTLMWCSNCGTVHARPKVAQESEVL